MALFSGAKFPLILVFLSAAEAAYPLYFASFEDVGNNVELSEMVSRQQADDQLTEWLDPCAADAFIFVRDSMPYNSVDLRQIRRLAEKSLTRGTFLTDYTLNLWDLADDVAHHCKAEFVVASTLNEEPIESYQDMKRRVVYLDFDSSHSLDRDRALTEILRVIPSPYITIVYTTSFASDKLILPDIRSDSRRSRWPRRRDRANSYVQPVIAPKAARLGKVHELDSEAEIDIPERVVLTIFMASSIMVLLLLLKNLYT